MGRKSPSSLEEQRADIKKKYKRGRKTDGGTVRMLDDLGEVELAVVRESACFYKAAGYPYSYIANALSLTTGQVRGMFNDAVMVANVQKISQNFIDGAVKLLKTYAIELIEMLVEIARTAEDEKVALNAITEALDRIGISKVNKSDSLVRRVDEIEVTDTTGLVERAKGAPPEVQQALAEAAEKVSMLLSEHAEPEAVA